MHHATRLSPSDSAVGFNSILSVINETQEMLDLCAQYQIESDVEVIPIQQVNETYERVLRGDVRHRFVIDLNLLRR